jgi:PKD repeat protein
MIKHLHFPVTIFLFTSCLLLSGCSKTPEACIKVDTTTLRVDMDIQFNASCSTNADDYNWDFGDGSSGYGAVITHKYANAKSYTVKLVASNSSHSSFMSQDIVVTP